MLSVLCYPPDAFKLHFQKHHKKVVQDLKYLDIR